MIRYLRHGQIDQSCWNDCVAKSINGMVYASSWYLDLVHPGWEALVEVIDGNYQTVMPLTCKKKYLIPYLCQPFFAQQLGVFSRLPLTQEKVSEFLRAIPKKFFLVEIRLNEGNALPERTKGVEYHRNCILDLHEDYDMLYSNYHENTRRNLKKSLNNGLQLVKGIGIRTVIDLFRKDRGATVSHWKEEEYARLERLAGALCNLRNASIYGIKKSDSDDIICGALFVITSKRITFLFSGNSESGKSCQAMTFLLDQLIREYAGSALSLDFEGSDDPNLARFYLGFGAAETKYPSYNRYLRGAFHLTHEKSKQLLSSFF